MVRGKFCGAKGAAQFKKPVQTGTRGSGSPLSLVSYGIKHETDGKMFGITPWRCFFTLYQLNYISRSLQKKNLWGLSTAPLQAEAFHDAAPVPSRLPPAFRPGIQHPPSPTNWKQNLIWGLCKGVGTVVYWLTDRY